MESFRQFWEAKVLPTMALPPKPIPQSIQKQPRIKSNSHDPVKRHNVGIGGENLVIAVLNKLIGPTKQSSEFSDTIGKIDATIHNDATGKDYLAQIKTRESGNDIIVELYKSYPDKLGRDMITKADLYLVMESSRQWIYCVDANLVKNSAKKLLEEWEAAGKPPTYEGTTGKLFFQSSLERVGKYKVLAYLPVLQFLNNPPPGFPARIRIPDDMKK